MSVIPQSAADLSDEQLAEIVRFIARCCLETERGLRPPDHLTRLMDHRTARRWQPRGLLGRYRAGPVRPHHDIAPPQLTRLTDDHVIATVITRTSNDRWGALTLRLRVHGGRWHLADLQRLLAAIHYRDTSRSPDPPQVDAPLAARIRSTTDERRMAAAALTATTRRLAELTPPDPGHQAARELTASWKRTVARLDRELHRLRTRRDTLRSLGHPARR
jgi:hypothetical protein